MALETTHDVNRGLYRLLNAPSDVDGGTPVPTNSIPLAEADETLRKVFAAYRNGFSFFYPHCERWWRGCIESAQTASATREEAVQAAFERRLAGPASAPEFVWFIRYFWLKCDAANKALSLERRVAPQVILLKWLADADEQDNVRLVTCMPYWPMGLDEAGEWC